MGGKRYSIAWAVFGRTPKKSVAARAASPIFLMAPIDESSSCSADAARVVDWIGDDNENACCCTKAEAEEAVDRARIRMLGTLIAIPNIKFVVRCEELSIIIYSMTSGG